MIRMFTAAALVILAGMLLLPGTSVFAQVKKTANTIRVPVYKSKKDSLRLEEIKKQLAILRGITPTPAKKLDSLIQQFIQTRDEVITYRITYLPAADHITLDSLLGMKSYDEVTKVSIYNYSSGDLPDVLFRCRNLESLELINTGINRLPSTLNDLKKLKVLAIYNPATRQRIKLKENHSIDQFIIKSSHCKQLPRSYRPFAALEVLDLSDNALTRFPKGARHNKLRELILSNNRLTLKHLLRKHPQLETLTLQHNEIRRVPRSIKRFSNLKKLSFNYNHISSVHPAIRHLGKLENLSFYHNELPDIPLGVYALTSLREIDLFHNHIESISQSVRAWKNLKTLYLAGNRIASLPDVIGELPALEGLYLWDNYIEQLPEELGALKTLRFLWLNNNNLHQLPASLFHLENIEELDVSHNDLAEISASVFDFKRIKILSLGDNPWNEKTLQFIHEKAELLRARDVFVHVPEK